LQLDKAGASGSGTITATHDFTAPFDCVDGTQTTEPLTMTPLSQDHDLDYWATGLQGPDGCSTWEELGASQTYGGLRDPFNFWDFFDVPTGAWPNLQRDKAVQIGDISAVVARFGANDANKTAPINRNSDPLSPPPASGYHPAYDRGGVSLGPNIWNVDAPDGSITIGDITKTQAQFGHTCVVAP